MFKPKQTHPKWYLWLYPYLSFLRYDRKMFFRAITGRANFHWHYEWEKIELVDIERDKAHRKSVTDEEDVLK